MNDHSKLNAFENKLNWLNFTKYYICATDRCNCTCTARVTKSL